MDEYIEATANWFLNKEAMPERKLQKLCYYAYSWAITLFNDDIDIVKETLWDEPFQAWIHGPVLPSLYDKYKEYGWQNIPKIEQKPDIPENIETVLQQVWDAYGEYSADTLEEISRNEDPWQKAREGFSDGEACVNEISIEDIYDFFNENLDDDNENTSDWSEGYDF